MTFPFSAEAAELLRGRIVFCGFSGGSDSLYLLLALKEKSAHFDFQLRALHFNHGLRGAESDADETWCREKCLAESIPFQSIRLNVNKERLPGEGDEAAARRLRLDEWKKLVRNTPKSIVALGHQADDRTENLLMRLFRGSNVSGLTSMRIYSIVEGVEFVRPLLSLERNEMERVLCRLGEQWRTDSTNKTPCYGRNFLRLDLIPAVAKRFPFAIGGMRRSFEVLEQDADYLEQEAKKIYISGTVKTPADWSALHPAIRCRVLRYFLESYIPGFIPDSALIDRFSEAVQNPPENGESDIISVASLNPYELYITKTSVFLHNELEYQSFNWNIKAQRECCFGAYRLTADLIPVSEYTNPDSKTAYFSSEMPHIIAVSSRFDGDTMIPFGKHNPVPLKKLYSDSGIKRYERSSIPVLRADDDIIWIPRVRRSIHWTVEENAEKMWRIKAEKIVCEHSLKDSSTSRFGERR